VFTGTNLFHAGSYLLIGPLFGYGDWSHLIEGLDPALLWQVVVTVAGLGLCLGSLRLVAPARWQPLFGSEPEGEARLRVVTRVALLTALVVSALAGLLTPLELDWALRAAVLGPLVLLWMMGVPLGAATAASAPLPRSWGWLGLGIVCAVLFVGVLGPGVGSFEGHELDRG
jgi:hypothetical protein